MTKLFPLDTDHTTRAWLATAAFMLALIVVMAPAAVLDERTLLGVSVWAKPVKFALSLAIHFVTLALLVQLLAPERRRGLVPTGAVYLSMAAALFEIVYIAIQAARGRHSHFNLDTPFEANMYTAMGVGAVLLVVAPFVLGLLLARERAGDRSGLRLGAVVGLLLAPVLTLVVAGYMSSVNFSHWVGEATSDAGGVPLLGWSREVGDLRPAHFVALHAMQLLPLVGFAADRLAPRLAGAAVWTTAAFVVAATAGLFFQALSGTPVWPQ